MVKELFEVVIVVLGVIVDWLCCEKYVGLNFGDGIWWSVWFFDVGVDLLGLIGGVGG